MPRIYTRGGDKGETSLCSGERVPKHSQRVAAYGDIDELNAALGLAMAMVEQSDLREMLREIQNDLFAVGAILAKSPSDAEHTRIVQADIERLEKNCDDLDEELEPLQKFVLPGGAKAGAALHLARTICRRAERGLTALAAAEPVPQEVVKYVNRLSDLLFLMARAVNKRNGVKETNPRY